MGVLMLYDKKRMNLFLKWSWFFVMGFFNLHIYANTLSDLVNNISGNESKFCTETDCFFPGKLLIDDDIVVEDHINWDKDKNLVLHTKRNIIFKHGGRIISEKNGSIILKSGMEPGNKVEKHGTVAFEDKTPQIEIRGKGSVKIYYNPIRSEEKHKYHNPRHYSYSQHVKLTDDHSSYKNLITYMLVNDLHDLQDIRLFLSCHYALSQSIDATETRKWNGGKGFEPLKDKSKNMPFSGNFDGNNYFIKGLFIDHRDEDEVGLFGRSRGREILHNTVENLVLEDFDITGNHYVGSLAGSVVNSDLLNIKVINPKIKSVDIAGGLAGTTFHVLAEPIQITGVVDIFAEENRGFVIGGAGAAKIVMLFEGEHDISEILKKYRLLGVGNKDDQTEIYLRTYDNLTETHLKIQDGHRIIDLRTPDMKANITEDNSAQVYLKSSKEEQRNRSFMLLNSLLDNLVGNRGK